MHEENRKYQKISKIPLIQQNLEEKKIAQQNTPWY